MKFPEIEGYRILALLGEGGMGAVYRAVHLESGCEVALKVMRRAISPDPEFVLRFKREAAALRSVRHPGVARFVDTGETGDSFYLSMEFVEGESLARRIADGPLAIDEACRVAAEVAEALAAAHEAGIVHRDVKPSNIILSREGARLTDFGLARRVDGSGLTTSGRVMGSLPYMAPEQIKSREVGPPADIYGLGVTLFEMLAGRLPFQAREEEAMAAKVLTLPAPILSRCRRDAPVGLDLLLIKMLAKQPELRPESAAAVAESLREVAQAGARVQAAGRRELEDADGLFERALAWSCRVLLRALPARGFAEPVALWAAGKARLVLVPGAPASEGVEAAVTRRRIRAERRQISRLVQKRDRRLAKAAQAEERAAGAPAEKSQDLERFARELRMEAEIFEERIADLRESVAARERRATRLEENARL